MLIPDQTVEIDYIPLAKQSLFHLSGAKYRLYIGAFRAGKSYAGCMEALKQSLLYPKNRGLIGRKDYTDLRDTTLKTFFDICPPALIKSYNKTEHLIILRNGSEIFFRELTDRAGLGSMELGWFYIDEAEQVEESVFDYLKGRLSLKSASCRGWLTSNPPNADHWIYRQFELSSDPDYSTHHASTYENEKNLPDGYIKDLEKLPPSWRKKYLEGQYGFTPDGLPYYEGYVESLHKRDLSYIPGQPLHCGWDFGYQHPAFVVTQIDNLGRWNILHEILGAQVTIDKFCDIVVFPLLAQKYRGATAIHYGDPACNQRNDKSEQTTYQILLSKGILLHNKPSEYRLRKEIIDKKINTITGGIPSLLVDTKCQIVNDGFLGGYHYPSYNGDKQFVDRYERPYHDNFYCLSGETKIRTLNGWREIKDLVGKQFISYAYDSFNKRLIPTKAKKCWKSGENVELWKLTHDEGELIATPNHLIMLRDGSYREMQSLKLDDELMPFYEADRSGKGHMCIQLNDGSIVDEHRYIYSWFKGNLREKHHIHHIDNNPRNNYPDNLEQLEKSVHMKPVYEKMRLANIQRAKLTGKCHPWTEESRKKISYWTRKRIKETEKEKQCPVCHKIFMGIDWGGRQHIYCSKHCLWKAQSIRKRKGAVRPYIGERECLKCGAKFKGVNASKYCSIVCRAQYHQEQGKLSLTNHKVKLVEFYGFGDVYDIEMESFHNFPANGVMVHNSHIFNALEYIAVHIFTPIQVKNRPRREEPVEAMSNI